MKGPVATPRCIHVRPPHLVALLAGVLSACDVGAELGSARNPLVDAPERTIREVVRIGGMQTGEEAAFQREPPIALGRDLSIYVLHGNLGRVAVFDSAGAFRRWIGRGQGEGPGEFTFATALGFVGDTLWVRNLTPPAITMFLTDGTFVRTDAVVARADYSTTMGVQGVSGYLRGGRAWMEPHGFLMGDATDMRAPFILGDRQMERQDTIFTWRALRGRLEGASFAPVAEPPFHAISPDGSRVVLAEWSEQAPADLLIRIIDTDGTEWSWTIAVTPRPMPAAISDSLVAAAQEQLGQLRERLIAQGIPADQAPEVPNDAAVREQAWLPAHFPPIRAVRVGVDGTIWLHRTDGLRDGPWVAFDDRGAPLYQIQLPEGAHFRQASRTAIWGTETGEFDVPYVVQWKIVEPDST